MTALTGHRFVLVHGGFHGAWAKLTPELEALGHAVVAIDLPGAGERMHEKSTLATWRGALRDVIDDGDVLVGHSQGGFAISLAADEVPDKVGRLIYLSAAVPIEGEPMGSATASSTESWPETLGMTPDQFTALVDLPEQGTCVALTSREAANQLFYHNCRVEDQAWAFDHLTPLPLAPTLEPFNLPRFWNTPIARDYILCSDDYSIPSRWTTSS